MSQRRNRWSFGRSCLAPAAAVFCTLAGAAVAQAQFQPFVGGGAPVVGPGAVGGVLIDASGMLRELDRQPRDASLDKLRNQSSGSAATAGLSKGSKLRRISLRRLERLIGRYCAKRQPLPQEVAVLAGLSEVRFLFFYPSQNDVVLAGPAESWKLLPSGEVVGLPSGRPVLQGEDLVVALRYAFRQDPVDSFIGCSIEPTPQGMKRYRTFSRKLRGLSSQTSQANVLTQMEQAMGPQAAVIYGVPGSTRFAHKLLAADYRLKRIAMGHDSPPVADLTSYLDLEARSRRNAGGRPPWSRFWFVARYDAIHVSEDRLGYEFKGQGIEVQTGPSLVSAGAGQSGKSIPSKSARTFSANLTRSFPKVARQVPVFAELQNLVALTTVAELIAGRDAETTLDSSTTTATEDRASWRPTILLDDKACPVTTLPVPKNVPSLANARKFGGRHWLISVSGGVEIRPSQLAHLETLRGTADPRLENTRRDSAMPSDPELWWWD